MLDEIINSLERVGADLAELQKAFRLVGNQTVSEALGRIKLDVTIALEDLHKKNS